MSYFSIKLLAGSKVVLVESEGFEPELFIPIIKDNRIYFQYFSGNNDLSYTNERNCEKKVLSNKIENCKSTIPNKIELTPPDIIRRCKENIVRTPIIAIQNKVVKSPIVNDQLHLNHDKYKIIQLYRNKSENTPKKPAKLVKLSKNEALKNNVSKITIKLPELLPFADENCLAISEAISTRKIQNKNTLKTVKFIKSPPKTITKWRKCLTPIRTYSRIKSKDLLNNLIAKKPSTPRYIPIENITLPDYIRNPTKGIAPNAILIVKKKKLIRDENINISSTKFKKQLANTTDISSRLTLFPNIDINLRKPIHDRPYELLTNLNRNGNVSDKLTRMFQSRCIKKKVETKSNYLKLIGKISKPETNENFPKFKHLQPRRLII